MKTYIHVNQHVIKRNLKENRNDPAIIVRTYKGSALANDVLIQGPSRVMSGKLPCGARVWIETTSPVLYWDD